MLVFLSSLGFEVRGQSYSSVQASTVRGSERSFFGGGF